MSKTQKPEQDETKAAGGVNPPASPENKSPLELENEALKQQLAEMSGKLQDQEISKKVGAEVINHGDDKYKINVPTFSLDGEVYTIADLKENKNKVVDLLIESKSHVIEKIQ